MAGSITFASPTTGEIGFMPCRQAHDTPATRNTDVGAKKRTRAQTAPRGRRTMQLRATDR